MSTFWVTGRQRKGDKEHKESMSQKLGKKRILRNEILKNSLIMHRI